MNDYTAYFIGGPEDMTKRVIRVPVQTYVFPEAARMTEPTGRVVLREHRYDLRAVVQAADSPRPTAIYAYMGAL